MSAILIVLNLLCSGHLLAMEMRFESVDYETSSILHRKMARKGALIRRTSSQHLVFRNSDEPRRCFSFPTLSRLHAQDFSFLGLRRRTDTFEFVVSPVSLGSDSLQGTGEENALMKALLSWSDVNFDEQSIGLDAYFSGAARRMTL